MWVQQTDGGVQNLVIMDGVIYGGGHFDNVCVGVTDGATVGFHCPQNAATRHKLLAIDAATGDITVPDVAKLRQAGGTLEITLTATDAAGLSDEKTVTILLAP